jgi:hypothetical protein
MGLPSRVNDFWIITAYFNPCRYVTKRVNFERFAARLKSMSASLLVVELVLDDGDFELGGEHNVVRLRGGGVMWQKERLLNIAATHLPVSCTKIAWLDGDLLFDADHWLRSTAEALDRYCVVQPFSSCVRLAPGLVDWASDGTRPEAVVESFAAAIARDRSLAHRARYAAHGHTGFAWAARRELFDHAGLYDACVTGSGDHLMAHVFAGALDSICIPAMIGAGHSYAAHFARWAVEANRIVGGSLGFAEGRVLHLWHGEVSDRRYYDRNQEFKTFDFDPDRDLRYGANGAWEWAGAPARIRDWAHDLFGSRHEDGKGPIVGPGA